MSAPVAGQNDLAPSPWGTRRLWSLWDMINFLLGDFVKALDVLRAMTIHYGSLPPNAPLTSRADAISNLEYVRAACDKFPIGAADDRFGRILPTLGRSSPPNGWLATELRVLLEVIQDRIDTEVFDHDPRPKAALLGRIQHDWASTLRAFPSAAGEISAAVDCYALGHNTAAVFHVMRVAELGLRALARERKVVLPKGRPVEWGTWQEIIRAVETSVRGLGGTMAAGPKKDAALDFYSGAVGGFHAFKDKYRNMVMHVRSQYDEHDALQAISQVRDFMNGLSAKIGEATKGPIRRWP